MAIEKVNIETFLTLAMDHPVLDVRSPAEFNHAHIPKAISLPLFSDEERKIVGTAYKQQSRETAIKLGLDFFGSKMRTMVEKAESIFDHHQPFKNIVIANDKTVLVHCWRGGMRSTAVAWLLDLYGFKVYSLVGGYKKFRHYVLDTFKNPYQFKIIGGYTGSGKTELLQEMEKQNEPVIDLENIAAHKGSAFGNLGMPPQPSQEMFENLLALALRSKKISQIIWLEDESQRIGDLNIPMELWNNMRTAPVYFIDIPFETRLQHIINWYGIQSKEKMINAILRIKKRLGGLETKTSLQFLGEDNIPEALRILLKYYDKSYSKALENRSAFNSIVIKVDCSSTIQREQLPALLKNVD